MGSKKKNTKDKKESAPKKPRNAYFLFAADIREEITQANPGIKVGEISKITGQRWKGVDEETKKKYQKQAEEEKGKYEKLMEEYRKAHPEPSESSDSDSNKKKRKGKRKGKKKGKKKKSKKDPNAPKGPQNAYMLYAAEVREAVMKENKGLKVGEISKIIGKMWKELPEKNKKKFQDTAKKAREEYKTKMEEYNKNKKSTTTSSTSESTSTTSSDSD
eukprot:Anaeramoba_ignava/a478736_225.p1 GENE.a478736_225~~a478736_225.p1  ORF type:complete len:217 (+),score=101.37 a478736_225:47-697(+)